MQAEIEELRTEKTFSDERKLKAVMNHYIDQKRQDQRKKQQE